MYHICWQWANLNCVCTNLNWWSVLTEISGVINCFSAVSTEQCCASAALLWPCVHPSGTSWYCTKMAKCRITQQCLWTPSFQLPYISGKFDCGHSNRSAKYRWSRWKSAIFNQCLAIYQKRCAWKANRNSYALYRMVLFRVMLSDHN